MPTSIISTVPSPLITLTTDFGLRDHYVGVMKGVIAGIAPDARIVDICHEIPAYDVAEGAFTIAQAYHWFPAGTIHVVVVDPGVGSARRPIVAEVGGHVFVAPDNGVLSQVFERATPSVFSVDIERYALKPTSQTFHGRDVFAPVAAHLANGVVLSETGTAITDFIQLEPTSPMEVAAGVWKGRILHIDQFGNLVTSFPVEFLDKSAGNFRLKVGGMEITYSARSYAEAPPGKAFFIAGSSGYVEVSVNQASAAERAGAAPGAPVEWIASPTHPGDPAERTA
jgi:S-adenosylmethionine hydrolase